jgi:hypothetical protein
MGLLSSFPARARLALRSEGKGESGAHIWRASHSNGGRTVAELTKLETKLGRSWALRWQPKR